MYLLFFVLLLSQVPIAVASALPSTTACQDQFSRKQSWVLHPPALNQQKLVNETPLDARFHASVLVPVFKEWENQHLQDILVDLSEQTHKPHIILNINVTANDVATGSPAYKENMRVLFELTNSGWFKALKLSHSIIDRTNVPYAFTAIGLVRQDMETLALAREQSDFHIIVHMDADCRLHPNFIRTLLYHYQADPNADAVISPIEYTLGIDRTDELNPLHLATHILARSQLAEVNLVNYLTQYPLSGTPGISYRSSAAKRLGLGMDNENAAEDVSFFSKLHDRGTFSWNWSLPVITENRLRPESYDGALELEDLTTNYRYLVDRNPAMPMLVQLITRHNLEASKDEMIASSFLGNFRQSRRYAAALRGLVETIPSEQFATHGIDVSEYQGLFREHGHLEDLIFRDGSLRAALQSHASGNPVLLQSDLAPMTTAVVLLTLLQRLHPGIFSYGLSPATSSRFINNGIQRFVKHLVITAATTDETFINTAFRGPLFKFQSIFRDSASFMLGEHFASFDRHMSTYTVEEQQRGITLLATLLNINCSYSSVNLFAKRLPKTEVGIMLRTALARTVDPR